MNIMWILILFLVISLVLLFYYLCVFIALIIARGVPFVPLSKQKLNILNNFIKLKQDDKVVDLGSGDGRVLRLFEKQGVNDLTGYEINLGANLRAWVINKIKNSKIKIYNKNFFYQDLSGYDKVFVYLLPEVFPKLIKKFDTDLKPKTQIISFAFEIKNWKKPTKIFIADKNKPNENRVFVYEV